MEKVKNWKKSGRFSHFLKAINERFWAKTTKLWPKMG
jgi:hypothetical protein